MSTTTVIPSANETTAAAPATTATPAKQLTPPKPGDVVRIRKIFGAGKGVELYAIVLTVAPSLPELVGEDGMPTITVAFVKSGVAIAILGSGNWHQAFDRVANVAPASHPEVKAGARGIFWVDVLPDPGEPIAADSFASANLPQVEGKVSTVFSREKSEEFFDRPSKTVPLAVEPITENAKAETNAAPEAQGSGSERNGSGAWTEAGDGTSYPATANPAHVTAEALAEQAAHDSATGNVHGLPEPTALAASGTSSTVIENAQSEAKPS